MATTAQLLAALRRFGLEEDRFDSIVARRLGAPPVEFKAMDHLHEAGSLTASELADRLALTSGAVTALIDRLERLGWARREPHPTDRRSVVVCKAERSDSEAERIFGPFVAGLARAAAELSPDERAAAVRFLEAAGATARTQADALKQPGTR